MGQKSFRAFTAVAAVVLEGLIANPAASAGIFDMMNPSRWFGNDRDRHYYGPGNYWGPGHYGGYGGPGYWGGPGYYGYSPYGGWGGPWGGYRGYGYGPGSTIVVTPQTGSSQKSAGQPPRLPE